MKTHTPNHIPIKIRIINIVLSILLLGYGTYGVYINDIYIPGKSVRGIHISNVPMWILYAAMLCTALNLLSIVADHYDQRNNETNYRLFARVTQITGWVLFIVAILLDVIIKVPKW